MSERQQAKCILSIEIFSDNIMVIQYNDQKEVLKIKNPLFVAPMLLSLLVIPLGTEKVKDIETWLDRVWIKRVKRA